MIYPPLFLLPLCLISPCFLSSKRQRSTVLEEKPVSAIISPVLQFECFSIKERTSLIFSSEGVMGLRLTFGRTFFPWIFLPFETALYPRRPSMIFLAIFSWFFVSNWNVVGSSSQGIFFIITILSLHDLVYRNGTNTVLVIRMKSSSPNSCSRCFMEPSRV